MPVNQDNPIFKSFLDLTKSVGQNVLHSIFPKDFEAYFLSFELVDSLNRTTDFLTFPVQPEQISEDQPRITSVKKSAGGITSIKTDTFVTRKIRISGTFGRKFKIVVGNEKINASAIAFSFQSGVFSKLGLDSSIFVEKISNFSFDIKTGYGLTKLLEAICDKSDALDQFQKPYRLFLYNTILGNNYQVNVDRFEHSQSQGDSNMLPRYSIEMTAVAPLSSDASNSELGEAMTFDALNKGLEIKVDILRSIVNNV